MRDLERSFVIGTALSRVETGVEETTRELFMEAIGGHPEIAQEALRTIDRPELALLAAKILPLLPPLNPDPDLHSY